MKAEVDHYAILGVQPSAEDVVIRAAYRALAQRYHPDRFEGDKESANKKMAEINEAYRVLSDPIARKEYDASRAGISSAEAAFDDDEEEASSSDPLSRDWATAVESPDKDNHASTGGGVGFVLGILIGSFFALFGARSFSIGLFGDILQFGLVGGLLGWIGGPVFKRIRLPVLLRSAKKVRVDISVGKGYYRFAQAINHASGGWVFSAREREQYFLLANKFLSMKDSFERSFFAHERAEKGESQEFLYYCSAILIAFRGSTWNEDVVSLYHERLVDSAKNTEYFRRVILPEIEEIAQRVFEFKRG